MPAVPDDDYYAVLGVSAGANAEALRRAWRDLAARWHPDRAGAAATARFQQLSAAYAVLADPLARAAYDRRRAGRNGRPGGGRETGTTGGAAAASSTTRTSSPPQPGRPRVPGVMLSRLSRPIALLETSGAVRFDEPGFITLVLRPEEAARGGMIAIPMRVDVWCRDCAGATEPAAAAGRAAACARCGGRRKVEELFSAWLAVPPGVAAGEVLKPSVELRGTVEPVRFRVRIFGTG